MIDLLTYEAAAGVLGVTVRDIRNFISSRRLRCVRLSHKNRRVARAELERFVNKCSR